MSYWSTVAALTAIARGPISDPEAHVAYVTRLLREIDPHHRRVAHVRMQTGSAGFPAMGKVHVHATFDITRVRFAMGDRIQLHNHPDMTGVIRCLSGTLLIDSYDLLDEEGPPQARFRETLRLGPDDVATLTPSRGNLHALRVEEPSELIEVLTPPYTRDRLERMRWYRHAQPVRPEPGVVYPLLSRPYLR